MDKQTTRNSKNHLIENREVLYCEKPPFPRNIMVELTNICNHTCVFCGYKDMHRGKRFCDKDFTIDIMRQAYECGAREIGFYLIGEPFLHPDIAEFVENTKKIGYEYIYITTNGAKATPEKLKQVIHAGLDSIKFSVNGATTETYHQVHGSDDYTVVKENISWLRNYLDKNGINLKTFISFVKCNINENDISKLHSDFDYLVDKVYIYECGNQGGSMAKLVELGIVNQVKSATIPCDMIFNRLHITCEGFLDACCADPNGKLVYANLHKQSLQEAWHSETIVHLRKQHLNGFTEHNSCYNCANNTSYTAIPLLSEI